NQTILSENIPDLIESRAIETQIVRNPAVDAAQDPGALDIHLRTLPKLPQISAVRSERGGVCGKLDAQQMIDDDSEIGRAIGEPYQVRNQGGRGIRRIHDQTGLRQRLEVRNELRLRHVLAEIPAPQVPAADAPIQRIAV